MLILTRKKSESILIGDDIEIIISDIKKNSVRIGIDAPQKMNIYRKEIYDKVYDENKMASNSNISSLSKVSKLLKLGAKNENNK